MEKGHIILFVGLFFGVFFTSFVLATCGDGICEGNENYCTSSSTQCDDPANCSATTDCGPDYCPDDCDGSEELNACVRECKTGHNSEGDRSPCIKECKHKFGFDDYVECLPCGDACMPYDVVVVADCLVPTRDFECGSNQGKCVILDAKDKLFEGYEDSELEVNAGTTPDSPLYFFDKF